jgi:hypothetical protein
MLEFIISSVSRRKILNYFLKNQDKEFHLRELGRNMDEPAPIIKRELDRLEQIGLILSWTVGNRRYFKVNKNFLFFPELKSLVDKAAALPMTLKVAQTFTLKESLGMRSAWEKRSKEIIQEYGDHLKRRRPRHPAEGRMLEKIS